MKNRTRQLISTALITSILSILIGGFAVVSTYRSEIAMIDKRLNQVESDIRVNPMDAVSIALLSIEQNNLDLTLGFATPSGEVTVLRESVGTPLEGPDLRIRTIPIPEGDKLIVVGSLVDINRSLDINLWKLLIFIVLANILASIATSLLSRSGALAQERAQRQKMQEFIGDAAHELRTPMTVVKGYAELLKGKQLDPERESAAFDRLNSELKRMDFLIGDLLMLAQLGEEGNIEFESIDIAQLVRESVSDFKEIAPTHPVTTHIDESAESVGTPLNGPDLRVRIIPIPEGDKLIVAGSLAEINRSLDINLWKLLIFIILANILASIATSLLSRSGALAQERLQRQKMQEFIGDAAHELRTPMTVVKGYAELLKGKQLDPERESAAFERLNSELKRMDFLIGDLLMLAQLGEEGNIEFESIDIAQLVRESVSDFKEIAPTHPVTTHIDESAELVGSEKYLQRFIQNALTNIRLHTPASTSVRVSVKADKQITIIIEDSGPGLPPESYGEKIRGLKRFDRSRSRDTGGTGLGMSIMNAVIERHKGTFTLRKSELGGLAIEVHLPRT